MSTFLLVILYAGCFYAFQYFLYATLMVPAIPNETNLISWDAGYYRDIANTGYDVHDGNLSRLAFFPLFPLVWEIAHVGVWGIVVINILFFATGFSILCS